MRLIEQLGWWVREGLATHDLSIAEEVYEVDCYRLAEWAEIPQVVVDVGGYIGAFARTAHERWPQARIIVVEADKRNLPAIQANAPFATLIHAAATYEKHVAICSSIFPGSRAASNSSVFRIDQVRNYRGRNWEPIAQELPTVTLENLVNVAGGRIDLLKLDCEGSEFNLLRNAHTATLDAIGRIVGEFHGDPAGGYGLPGIRRIADERFPERTLKTWKVTDNQHQGLFSL